MPRARADRSTSPASNDAPHFNARFALPPGIEQTAAMIVNPDDLSFAYRAADFSFEPRAATSSGSATDRPLLVSAGGCSCGTAPEPDGPDGSDGSGGLDGPVVLLLGALGCLAGCRSASRRALARTRLI